jgi:hypothetical protein
VDFIIYVKKHVFLKVVEKAIVDVDASNKNIAPQPLNTLVVYAFARYVAATVWSPSWMSKHIPSYVNIFHALIPSYTLRQPKLTNSLQKVIEHR